MLSDSEKQRVIDLVTGQIQPGSGIEKHFLRVVNGFGMACSPEEKQWIAFYREYRKPVKGNKSTTSETNTQLNSPKATKSEKIAGRNKPRSGNQFSSPKRETESGGEYKYSEHLVRRIRPGATGKKKRWKKRKKNQGKTYLIYSG
jgi:uncharacterized protein YifE (UPF0438 family)